MSNGVGRYAREFLRILALVAIAAPISAIAVGYAHNGELPSFAEAIDFSWSRLVAVVLICAIVAALPSRKVAK